MFASVEKMLKPRLLGWPVEFLDIIAKLTYRTFELGSQEFSFNEGRFGYHHVALELLLISFSTNSSVVLKLIIMAALPKPPALEYRIAMIVIKMLLGCKNISLEPILNFIYVNTSYPES